jgi:hypothetical protein
MARKLGCISTALEASVEEDENKYQIQQNELETLNMCEYHITQEFYMLLCTYLSILFSRTF